MGTPQFDLDPASCAAANKRVNAKRYFTVDDDGLAQPWVANTVWLNHPFGRPEKPCRLPCAKERCKKRGFHRLKYKPGNADWMNKLLDEYINLNVGQACCITFASTSEAWFQPLMRFPQCFLFPRTHYYQERGNELQRKGGVPRGSVVTYLGDKQGERRFARAFEGLGTVKVAYQL